MKKKLMIIVVMLLVCTGMFVLAQKAQSSVIDRKNKAEAAAANKSSENKKVVDNKVETNKATETPKEENKEQTAANSTESKPNNNGSEVGKSSTKQTTSAQPAPGQATHTPSSPVVPITPSKDSNFAIVDEVNNKIILEKKIDFDNVTVDFITCKLLKEVGINYGNDDEGTATSYFYSIAGLTERKSGPLSGWCFYVNSKKPGMGAGSYIYHKGDVLVWKYMRDAVNSK